MAYDIGASIGITGEAEFKNAMKGVSEQFKLLGSEMKLAVSQFDKNDKSTEALTARSKVLGQEIDVQKGKISLLTDQYGKQNTKLSELKSKLEDTKAAFGADSDEVRKAQKEYDAQTTAVNKLGIELNNSKAELNKMDRQLETNNDTIKKSSTNFDGLSDKINSKVNGAFKGLAIGIGAITASMGLMLRSTMDNADTIMQLADITGLSAERLQELQYVGAKVDVELETMTGSQSKLIKAMAAAQGGAKTQSDAFKTLGVSVTDSNGNLRDSNVVFMEAIDALGKMQNPTEQSALALKIFGRGAMELNPLIKAGSTEIANLTEEARKSGAVISGESMGAIDKFGDSTAAMKLQLTGVISQAFVPLMPQLQKMSDKLADIDTKPLTDGFKWVMDNGKTIAGVIGGVVAAMLAWKVAVLAASIAQEAHNVISIAGALATGGLTGANTALTAATGGKVAATLLASGALIAHNIALGASAAAHGVATAAQWLFNAALTANPIGIVIVLIAALIAAVVLIATHWKEVTAFLMEAWEKVKKVFEPVAKWFGDIFNKAWTAIKGAFSSIGEFFGGVWDKITGIFKTIGTTVGDAIGGAFKAVVNSIIGFAEKMINNFINSINFAIKLINKIPGVDIPRLKELNIPRMDVGTRYLPADMLIMAHRGEMIVPRSENPYANSGGGTLPMGGSNEIIALLQAILERTEHNIYIGKEQLIGATAGDYNLALGKIDGRR
jgi:phage-related protein